ncbi:MAG: RloB family protein [Alphaproteobacteria bacterium]|nr:RloB family protein [Alphaproteobacteria bacterium]
MGASKRFDQKIKDGQDIARLPPTLATYKRVLVVCEGKKTEPNYFEGLANELKIKTANIKITGESGSAPKSVVDHAKNLCQDAENIGNSFEEVYCVIDKDRHPDYPNTLEQIRQLESKGFHAIPSVPCFEYFLLLHFKYTTKPFPKCKHVESALKKHLPDYDKGDKNMFANFSGHLETAKTNAAKSLAHANNSETDNPSTKAHELVQYMQDIKEKRKTP